MHECLKKSSVFSLCMYAGLQCFFNCSLFNDCMHCSVHSSASVYLIWTTALSFYIQCCMCILTSWIGDLYANNVKSEKSKHFMQICCNWEHFLINKVQPEGTSDTTEQIYNLKKLYSCVEKCNSKIACFLQFDWLNSLLF